MAVNTVKNSIAYGLNNALQSLSPLPIIAKRQPSSSDIGELGQVWIYSDDVWMFTSSGNWSQLASAANDGVFTSLTVNGISALNGALTVASGTGAINISADAAATSLNIGTGAGVKTIAIGSTNSSSSTAINSGTGGITISSNSTGNISLVSNKVSSASTTVTNSSFVGNTTITGLTTASAATFTVTMTNTKVTTSSAVLVTVSNLNASTNGAAVAVKSVVIAANTITIVVVNNGSGALGTGDDVHIAHMVLN